MTKKHTSRIVEGRYQLLASLRVQGNHVDFDEISRIIGVVPSKVIEKGSLSKLGRKYEVGTWIFDSQLPEHYPLEAHLRWFAKTLPNADHIKGLRDIQGIEDVDVFCAISADATTCAIVLPVDVLSVCREMAVDLEMSFVFGNMQTSDALGEHQVDVDSSSPAVELNERSCAVFSGTLLPDAQTVLQEALESYSEASSLIHLASSEKLELTFDVAIGTAMSDGSLPDVQLRKLGDTLGNHVQDLKRLGNKGAFSIMSRFETNCEWASTRLSWQAFDLPVLLNCPLTLEAILI